MVCIAWSVIISLILAVVWPVVQSGINAGKQVFGQDPLWLAWVTDLINYKDAGNMEAYKTLLTTVTPACFKVGQMIGATGLLLGVALAMSGIIHLRVHSFGNLEFITRIPMSIKAGLGGDIINFVICVVAFFIIGYFVAYFMIGKFKFATPGRLENYMDDNADDEPASAATSAKSESGKTDAKDSKAERIIALLGGRENIILVDACMTRLRVTVKDLDKVAELAAWKSEGALGLIKKDNGIQAVYGPKADVLKSDINDIL